MQAGKCVLTQFFLWIGRCVSPANFAKIAPWRTFQPVRCYDRQNAPEAAMTGILDKFYVEHGSQGSRVMVRSQQLTGSYASDDAIDAAIQMLKDDLDACAKEMKRFAQLDRRGALFEGWPSANDDVVDG